MSPRRQPTKAPRATRETKNPYGYPFWEWVAREDPEYVKARQPLSALSIGEGKELSVKYREMVIIGILASRGARSGGAAGRSSHRRHRHRPAGGVVRRSRFLLVQSAHGGQTGARPRGGVQVGV